jgi:hypothetical protein
VPVFVAFQISGMAAKIIEIFLVGPYLRS